MRQIASILIAIVISVLLVGCPPPPQVCAVLYADADYSGASKVFYGKGSFNLDSFNDIASSLRMDSPLPGCTVSKVTLFEHANYQGRSKEYTGDTSFLGDFNDIVSSIIIE